MSNSDGLDAFSFAATDALDSDDLLGDESSARPLVLSAVWKSNTLGIAFMEGTELRFAQVADPDFRLLQACKYQLKPSLIVAPSSSDAAWWDALKAPCLLAPGLAGASDEDGGDAMEDGSGADGRGHTIDGADDGAEDGDGAERGGPRVLALKKRDFSPETATKRLALLRTLKDLPSADLTEKEVLIYLEHQAPREQEQARRALAGLLTYLSRAGDEMGERLVVTALRRFSLESQLFMAPECFVSLGIFADDYHPSAHGGRAKDGFSIWSLMNRTKSKPGERMLRTWFARPTQDLSTLRERQGFIGCLASAQNAQLLPVLHAEVGKVKDVTKLEASLSRGGLLLSDFNAVVLTASSAVKAKELLVSAEVPAELPAVARALRAIDYDLYTVANTVGSVVDFEASKKSSRLCPGAAKHIAVSSGVHQDLDELREQYATIEPVLTELAGRERERLNLLGMLPDGAPFIVYVPQLGFLIKVPLAGMAPEQAAEVAAAYSHVDVGLDYQFDADGEFYFKGGPCSWLDERYGDISSQLKDIECALINLLEEKLKTEWLPLLIGAQHALAELDALLALAVCARDMRLVRPTLTEADAGVIQISGGWHPLLASPGDVASGHAPSTLVPNDCEIGSSAERLMLLTGPNASGKTVFLRTVALVVYLAHIGSYVPAETATIARTDAIHTRMHSKESAAVSASAFMLDLSQMAAIFRHATARSLCLIDEFGKGTNAQDGISLLYASLAELLQRGANCPRVLACTHYTELLEIPGFREQPGLSLWTMQVLLKDTRSRGDEPTGAPPAAATIDADDPLGDFAPEDARARDEWQRGGAFDDEEDEPVAAKATGWYGDDMTPLHEALDDEVVFLYKAARGACVDSFGSHCAAQADMPLSVIQRARHVSRCRLEGRPIERYDVDSKEAEATERDLAELVDTFLQYDFLAGTAKGFFDAAEPVIQRIKEA